MAGLKGMVRYLLLAQLPAGLWLGGCVIYFLVTAPLERFTDIRVPYDQVLMFRTGALLAAAGLIAGGLIWFLTYRNNFRFVQKYLILFISGALIPSLASVVQYRWYIEDPSQFSFDLAAKETVGHSHTESTRQELAEDIRRTKAFAYSARAVLTDIQDIKEVAYADPLDYWKAAGNCRRLDIGDLSGALCVERETTSSQAGVSYSYWPIIRELPPSGVDDGFRVDLFFLTGKYRCPVPNDLTGGGGLNFLRHETVDGEKLRLCLKSIVGALDSKVNELSQREAVFAENTIMPYWYFLSSSIFTFVGSDFALLKPVGFWPVVLSAGIAVFRYLFFAVVVVVLLGSTSRG